jgi:hypothetical protein
MNFNRANTRIAAVALAVAAAFGATSLSAAEPNVINPKFRALDKNGDGFITRDEVVGTRWYQGAFTQADENGDGRLDQNEFTKAEAVQDRASVSNYTNDTYIKAKVKTALLRAKGLKSRDLDIEVVGGEVLVSGFVRDENQRGIALAAASSVHGVVAVKDAMYVR